MNRLEQKRFVKELSANVVKEVIAKIDNNKIPENWDGVELRQLLADRFDNAVCHGILKGKRKQNYKNACFQNNL